MGNMGMGNMEAHMKMMDAADARLDSLVTRMHAATGSAKTGAMERVLDELIAQRKMMRAHMMQMQSMMQMHQMPGMPGREHRDSLHHDDDDD